MIWFIIDHYSQTSSANSKTNGVRNHHLHSPSTKMGHQQNHHYFTITISQYHHKPSLSSPFSPFSPPFSPHFTTSPMISRKPTGENDGVKMVGWKITSLMIFITSPWRHTINLRHPRPSRLLSGGACEDVSQDIACANSKGCGSCGGASDEVMVGAASGENGNDMV